MILALAFGAVTAVLVGMAAVYAALVIEVARSGDVVAAVERFAELSTAALASLPDGRLLSDPDGATSRAIGLFLAQKEQAHEALWGRPQRPT